MGRYLWVKLLLFGILRVITFYPTRGHGYQVFVLSATIYVVAHIHLETTEPTTSLYFVGTSIAYHLTFTTYLLCAGGTFPNHWKRVRDGTSAESDASGSNNSPSNFPFKKKFWWMLDLAHSPRMVGWVQQPQNCLPACPPPSRRIFLRKTLLKLILNVVINDVLTFLCVPPPPLDSRFPQGSTYAPKTVFAITSFLHHAPYVVAFGVITATSISTVQNIASLTFVGLGCSSPTLWPDMWGNWGDAYTVRRLWGCVFQGTFSHSKPLIGRMLDERGTSKCARYRYLLFFRVDNILRILC